jgi:ABC-type Na+ efflux pump permease subunit
VGATAAVCCVLPFALPAAALASFGGLLAWLAGDHWWATMAALTAVVAAWLWVAYRSYRSEKRPAKSTVVVLLAATALFGVAFIWPSIEPSVVAWLSR